MPISRSTRLASILLLATAAAAPAHEDHAQDDDARAAEHGAGHGHETAGSHDAEHVEDDHDHGDDAHLAEAGGLRLVHAWSRATDADEALIFVEIENVGDSTRRLVGGGSPRAARAEIVGFRLVDGTPVYEPLPEVPIAPGAAMTLGPEGLALRLAGLDTALEEGDVLPVTFTFDDGLEIRASAQIEQPNATRHRHAGHMH